MNEYFQIQFYRNSDSRWHDSASVPNHAPDVNELVVWKAYVNYLDCADPDTLYRLVKITTTKKVEIIHV